MTDLTEQWKKGELPSADENHTWLAYYLKQASGRIHADSYWRGNWGHADRNSIIKVLAPVPSYEEFQNLKEYEQTILSYNMKPIDYEIACETVNKLLDERKALKEENAKLKELLKECRHIIGIEKDFASCHFEEYKLVELLTKIEEALK